MPPIGPNEARLRQMREERYAASKKSTKPASDAPAKAEKPNKSKLIAGLKDAVRFARGDKTKGTVRKVAKHKAAKV